jgi:hypothetical protein
MLVCPSCGENNRVKRLHPHRQTESQVQVLNEIVSANLWKSRGEGEFSGRGSSLLISGC